VSPFRSVSLASQQRSTADSDVLRVLSLAYCIVETSRLPEQAFYLVPGGRVWKLLLGARLRSGQPVKRLDGARVRSGDPDWRLLARPRTYFSPTDDVPPLSRSGSLPWRGGRNRRE